MDEVANSNTKPTTNATPPDQATYDLVRVNVDNNEPSTKELVDQKLQQQQQQQKNLRNIADEAEAAPKKCVHDVCLPPSGAIEEDPIMYSVCSLFSSLCFVHLFFDAPYARPSVPRQACS